MSHRVPWGRFRVGQEGKRERKKEPFLWSPKKEGLRLTSLDNFGGLWGTAVSLVVWYPALGNEDTGVVAQHVTTVSTRRWGWALDQLVCK